jgi:citrate synthase
MPETPSLNSLGAKSPPSAGNASTNGLTSCLPFWRNYPLSDYEQILFKELLKAHAASVHRENCSTTAFLAAASGSRDFLKGVCAALCSVGEVHAPLQATYEFLDAYPAFNLPERVPGWGNSFVREEIDPIWAEVWKVLLVVAPTLTDTMSAITEELHSRDKRIFPNPSALTAACCIAMQVPKELCGLFFVLGRVEGWGKLYFDNFLKEGV